MGGSSSGSNEIPETAQQYAQAQVARQQWALYESSLKPWEDVFMQSVDKLNSETEYADIAGTANLGYQSQFGEARKQAATQLAASGADPGSGKFQSTLAALEGDQAAGMTDTASRAQTSQADKYIAGLQDVTALGAGQKAQALAGFDNLADTSLRRAGASAQAALTRKQGTGAAFGAGIGALGALGLSKYKKDET